MNEATPPDRSSHPQMQLLPWYLSGTLNIVETRQVTAHLAHCELCRGELESLTLMRRVVRQSFAESGPGVAGKMTRTPVGIILACVFALQLAVIVRLWTARPVAAATAAVGAPRKGTQLRLIPNPNISARLLEDFLHRLEARMVDGPDGDGSYVVVIPTADPGLVAETVAVIQSRPEVIARVATEK
jgi:anti-sigma factor RsiW